MRSIQPVKIKALIEERINKHYQGCTAINYLCNSEEEVNINGLLMSLQKLSTTPNSRKLLKALTERHSPQPAFLTVRDFARDSEDESLAWEKLTNEPVVYAATICIPDWLYDCMMERPELCEKKVLQNPSFDDMEHVVHLRGK
ncbi:unnamed protein product [Adineta steineri]|uniref:Uncharacterized protein n=2 Tax=Adineta steineri TaxID=433720 RepID=A0A819MRG7_9BILA|nr:unnamed protein product [Adineta steineri]CAF3984506.1 unnamed protein product [Adineta steineri]